MSNNKEQLLIDIMFEIAIRMQMNDLTFDSREVATNYVANQLKASGFNTRPIGMSWGVLIDRVDRSDVEMIDVERIQMKQKNRRLTLYRDDSTVQIIYNDVKAFFWAANNTVLVISRYTDRSTGAHHYIHWPRERFCWFKDEPNVDEPNADVET